MTASTDWWEDQPDAVQGVIRLALLRDHPHDPDFDRAVSTLLPKPMADMVLEIATDLYWVDRCENDHASDVIADYFEAPSTSGLMDAAAGLCDEKKADVLRQAQLVASRLAGLWATA